MKNHSFGKKFGKFFDTLLHGKWKKCKYYKTCEDARKESETCMHGGGEYCGKWKMKEGKDVW